MLQDPETSASAANRLQANALRRAEIGREKRARTRIAILQTAFALFSQPDGLFTRVEEICAAAQVTRQTFYNHFDGMESLRTALTHEVSHDFLIRVTTAISVLDDAAERAAMAIRLYLDKARREPSWGQLMVNISANGIIFGMETYLQAERTVKEGMAQGVFTIPDSRLGRDLIMGTTLSAIVTQLREQPGADHARHITYCILVALGVAADRARQIVTQELVVVDPD